MSLSRKACIIVVTFNSRRFLPAMRDALIAQTEKDFNLVVWDNGSRDEEKPSADALPPGATVILHEENIGFAAANNRAAALSTAPFIVLLNPDAFPEPNWLEELLRAAETHPEAGSIGSTQIAANAPDTFDGLGDAYHACGLPWRGGFGWPRAATEALYGEPFSACAAAALYRRDAWTAAGGFDETFFAFCEDVDLGFRLRLMGWRIVQWPKAIVAHVGGGATGRRSDFAIFHGTRNRIWTYVKNMPSWAFWLFLPAHIAMNALFLAVSPFRGSGPPTWRGAIAAIRGLPALIAQRTLVQRQRKTRVRDILEMMAVSPMLVARRAPLVRAIQKR